MDPQRLKNPVAVVLRVPPLVIRALGSFESVIKKLATSPAIRPETHEQLQLRPDLQSLERWIEGLVSLVSLLFFFFSSLGNGWWSYVAATCE